MDKQTKVLVTGGAGFIGTNFVYHLIKNNYQVVVLDKLTYAGGKDNLNNLNLELIVGDICDPEIVSRSLENIDWVVHFAAESHNTRSEIDPDIFYRTNVLGTQIMLEQSFKSNIKKFLHISTDEVYGSIQKGYFKESDKLLGDSQASSAYSKSKSLSDDLALEWGKKGYPVIVTRTTNNFGPWQYPEKILPRAITNLLTNKKITLWGSGLQIRDWLFAPENAKAIEFILKNGKNGQAYNVAANLEHEITNQELAIWLCEFLKLDPEEWIEYIEDPRPNHDFRYALDTTKLTDLGFTPKINTFDQFAQTVEWYKENTQWWQKRKEEAESIYK